MTEEDQNNVLEAYQKALKLLVDHMKICPTLERKVIKEFEIE